VVKVLVTLDEEGKTIEATAISGHLLLRAAAVEAARGARFHPTTLNGEPVKVTGIIIYNFATRTTPRGGLSSSEDGPNGASSSGTDSTTPPGDRDANPDHEKPRAQIVSGGVLNGRAIVLPQPDYPDYARAAGASGAVKVQVTVDEEGKCHFRGGGRRSGVTQSDRGQGGSGGEVFADHAER
jgi:outer membrane biosynthesis protein TonB